MSLTRAASDFREIIHGVEVADPFRWLEEVSSKRAQEWLSAQQQECELYFNTTEHREMVGEVLKALRIDSVEQPVRIGDAVIYRSAGWGEEQPSIWQKFEGEMATRLVDPRRFSSESSVRIYRVSASGRYLAYELRDGGTDTSALRVLDSSCGVDLEFSFIGDGSGILEFAANDEGMFFSRRDEATRCLQVVYLEFIGNRREQVILSVEGAPDDRLVICYDQTRLGAIHIRATAKIPTIDMWVTTWQTEAKWEKVLSQRRLPYSSVLHAGKLYAFVNDGDRDAFLRLDNHGETLGEMFRVEGRLVQSQFCDGHVALAILREGRFEVYSGSLESGELRPVALSCTGTIRILRSYSQCSPSLFLSTEGPTEPPSVWEFWPSSHELKRWHTRSAPVTPNGWIERYQAPTRDHHEIAITVLGEGKPSVGERRAIVVTAYGGFGIPSTPQYSLFASLLVERQAVFALIDVRAQERPQRTSVTGARANVETSALDLIDAVEWLIESGIGDKERIAIVGGSHGGLVVALALVLRPELFRAVVCVAPLTDLVRYERFGRAREWRSEYGSVSDAECFRNLLKSSPYHRMTDGHRYPAVLVISGGSDERCHPAHAMKFVARLQMADSSEALVMLDYTEQRGHTPVLSLSQRAAAVARRVSFLTRELRLIERRQPCVS